MQATLKDWMEVVQYKITEGSEYGWQCFGYNAYSLDYWSGDQNGYGMGIVFDRKTQEVYEVQVCDYSEDSPVAYRFINPQYVDAYKKECKIRGDNDEAWEEVKWIDLELFEDWVEKATAIRDGLEYDKRIMIPITLEDNELLILNKLAQEANLTLDQFVEKILIEEIERLKSTA